MHILYIKRYIALIISHIINYKRYAYIFIHIYHREFTYKNIKFTVNKILRLHR